VFGLNFRRPKVILEVLELTLVCC